MSSIYDAVRPTSYADPPELLSFSSLSSIESCPRRWQFLASTWGDYDRYPERPHPTALEGRIVHEAIELLIRELGRRGMPSIGTPRFRQAVEVSGFFGYFASEVEAWNDRLARHPRGGPEFVIRTPPRQLANRAIRLFRAQYGPRDDAIEMPASTDASQAPARGFDPSDALRNQGSLAEVRMTHPRLPFVGVLDLVQQTGDGIRIVDFKTGHMRPKHIEQVLLYALLWWRNDGEMPISVALQYQDQEVAHEVLSTALKSAESRLAERINLAKAALEGRPAKAITGSHCTHCAVRAKCDDGWMACCSAVAPSAGEHVDMEVLLIGNAGPSGFVAKGPHGPLDVVYGPSQESHVRRLRAGDRCRITRGVVGIHGEIELKAWTEVHLVEESG